MAEEQRDSTAKLVREHLEEMGDDVSLTADGFDDAIIGIAYRFNQTFVAYDYDMCIEILMRDEMTWEEASEYLEFNTIGAWVGDGTPVYVKFFTDKVPSSEGEFR